MEINRIDAVQAPVGALRDQYPKKGFSISPKIDFVESADRGMCIVAKQPLRNDETIMVLPGAARLSVANLFGNSDKKMKMLHGALRQNAPSARPCRCT